MHKLTPSITLLPFLLSHPLAQALPQPQAQDPTQPQLTGDVSALINPIPASTNLSQSLTDFTPLSAPDAGLTAGTVTINIISTAGPLPEDQIFVGLVASLALMYDKSLPPAQQMPGSGVTITFTAGLTHSIFVEPVLASAGGLRWLDLEYTLKALGLQVFNRKLSREILFDITIDGQRRGRGGVTSKPRTGEGNAAPVVVPTQVTASLGEGSAGLANTV